MKLVIIALIIVVGVVSAVLIFSTISSDTWKDKRTELAGVAPPDELNKKIDCLSKGGEWDDTSCNFPKVSESEFVYSEEQTQNVIDAFNEKYFEYGITEYFDSEGFVWKYQVKTNSTNVELILGDERVILRSYDAPDDSPLCMIINPFPKDVEDWCPPKW